MSFTLSSLITNTIAGATGATGPVGPSGATGPTGAGAEINYLIKTSNYTANNSDYIIANTVSGTFNITLPATPATGNYVVIADGGNFSDNMLVVSRNGNTIEGVADDLGINVRQTINTLIYDGSTWQVTTTVGGVGATGPAGPSGPTGPTGPTGPGSVGAINQAKSIVLGMIFN